MSLSAGDWVEVLSKPEILATLDEHGRLDGLPFMPEMFQYCGKRFRVWKRAHKTCDTVNRTGGRRMSSAVHLEELRCDGQGHGGCQAACLLFWKEAWLKRLSGPADSGCSERPTAEPLRAVSCTEAHVNAATRLQVSPTADDTPTYVCQATLLPSATTPLKWWDPRQYLEDYTSGNVPLRRLVAGALYVCFSGIIARAARRSGRLEYRLIALYDRLQILLRGVPYPRRRGTVPAGKPTPSRPLGLKAGDLVRVRPYSQVLDTLDSRNKNRGLLFDAEEVPYCGKMLRVRSVITRFVDERTGKMITLKEPSVLLDGAWCQARYSGRRMHCPRAIFAIWRETWLERPAEAEVTGAAHDGASTGSRPGSVTGAR